MFAAPARRANGAGPVDADVSIGAMLVRCNGTSACALRRASVLRVITRGEGPAAAGPAAGGYRCGTIAFAFGAVADANCVPCKP